MNDQMLLKEKRLRIISARRASKLRKRGEFVRWSVFADSYVWEWDYEKRKSSGKN